MVAENLISTPSRCPCGGLQQDVSSRLRRCAACQTLVTVAPAPPDDPAQLITVPRVAPDGRIRGRYRLVERLGEGAHGVTYLAEHEYLRHPCVVKVLPTRSGEGTDAAVRRLRDEARAGFRVNNPHVVRVLDCDVLRDVWYFVMEYVAGANLATIVESHQRVPWRQAVQLGVDAAIGLEAIHGEGLLHRDVKPSNLILGADGHLRVADLGVATLDFDAGEHDRAAIGMTGTLAYAAPEVFHADARIGPASDLYSLGVVLFQLLTGVLPHNGGKIFQRLIDLQTRDVTWPSDAPTEVPPWLVDVVLRLLAIEPAERFGSAAELLGALRDHAAPRPISAPPTPRIEPLQPRGVGVLPFENEGRGPDDDWLGYAIASNLSRALAEIHAVYVADQDGLTAMTDRLEGEGWTQPRERMLEAGRRVGAGMIVTGRVARDGQRVRVQAEVWRRDLAVPQPLDRVSGPLSELPRLEQALLKALGRFVDLGKTAPGIRRSTPDLEARERIVNARQAFLHGQYERAIELASAALEIDHAFSEAIGFLGVCLARLGRYDEANDCHRRQQRQAQRAGDARYEVEALANLGVMNYFRGRYEDAEGHLREAVSVADSIGLATESAKISNNLGFVLFRLGRPAEAEQAFRQAIETHRAYGGLTSLVGPYNGLGNVLAEQARYDEAAGYYRRALALALEVGDRGNVGLTHLHLGRCAAQQERFADAKHEFTMALSTLDETRFWNGLARAYEYIAEMNIQLGSYEEATRCADRRIELARQHANARLEAAAWRQKAESLRLAGREQEAVACLTQGRGVETGATDRQHI